MYTLGDIISEFLVEKGETQTNRFAQLYTIGLSGLREIHQDINGIIKIVELHVNSNDTVDLPDDYVKYSKVGVIGGDGRVHLLGLDNSLALNKKYNSCGVPIKRGDTEFVDFGYGLLMNNGLLGGYYNLAGNPLGTGGAFWLGGGQNAFGYFRYDRASNQLLLSNFGHHFWGDNDNDDGFPDSVDFDIDTIPHEKHRHHRKIVLEYVADVNAENGDFIIHPFIIQTIKDWISWKMIANDRNYSASEKQYRSHVYYNSRRHSNMRYNSHTVQEWTEALRKENTATTRF
jgi:hypothetical protein